MAPNVAAMPSDTYTPRQMWGDDTDVTPPLSLKCTPSAPSAQSDANTHTHTHTRTHIHVATYHQQHCLMTCSSRYTLSRTHNKSRQSCKVIRFAHVCLSPPSTRTRTHTPASASSHRYLAPRCGLTESRREKWNRKGKADRGRCSKALWGLGWEFWLCFTEEGGGGGSDGGGSGGRG